MSMDFNTVMGVLEDTFKEIQGYFHRPGEAQPYLLGILGLKRLSEANDNSIVQWDIFVKDHYHVGERLNDALRRVEEAYPEWRGWFEGLDYTFSSFADRQRNDRFWSSVIDKISRISLCDLIKDDPKALSRLCIRLNDQVSIVERKWRRLEPSESVVDLITALLRPSSDHNLYDPFCTSGVTLLEGITNAPLNTLNRQKNLYAQTTSMDSARLIKLNLFCAGIHEAQIAMGDVILNPGFVEGRYLQTFDRIACFIPTGCPNWGEMVAPHDRYGRFIYGIPPKSQGDYAYLEHCIASLSDDGVLVAGVASSMLFKERTEGDIRRRIIEADLIEAVIRLPLKLIPQASIQFNLLVIRRNKPEERWGKILFVDASKDFLRGRLQNVLRNEDLNAIEKVYHAFEEVEGFSTICSLKTIAEHNFILEVADYVTQPLIHRASFDLKAALAELNDLQEERCRRYNQMIETLTTLIEHEGVD